MMAFHESSLALTASHGEETGLCDMESAAPALRWLMVLILSPWLAMGCYLAFWSGAL